MGQKITPCLWFDMNAEEAIAFYAGIFEDVKITATDRYLEGGYGPVGEVMYVEFTMNGIDFSAINGGPEFSFNEAISLEIECKDQAEVDYFWEKLGAGGQYGPCGWLKDKYGLSWQVVPRRLFELIRDPDPARASAATKAMLQMGKLDVAELEAAANAA
ncbi:MAG TPA: VOC family protein [Thermomicrobiales bacterium]|nr:VOC family protein [Thermomicrobiales bacterium]